MLEKKKMSGKDRRQYILDLLKNAERPTTGKEIADRVGVSRQVIVTDIALLKTADEPIIATNRGYLYMKENSDEQLYRKIIICDHEPEEAELELNTIVDCGVTVVDVIVEHPVYGDLTGSLMIKSRFDVEQFIKNIQENEAALLSVLTNGIHLHTLEADNMEKIELACRRLEELGIIYKEI